jgi:hypothetical protein
VLGLTGPLLQAGARLRVATSWRIRDQAAVAFVKSFYDALARDLPVADALRAAKLDALRRGARPNEWAVFTAVGDPLVRVPLRKPPLVASGWVSLVLGLPWWPQRARRPISSGCAGFRTADSPLMSRGARGPYPPAVAFAVHHQERIGNGHRGLARFPAPQTTAPLSSSTSSS